MPAEVTRAVDDASPDDGTVAESASAEVANAAPIDVLLVFRKAINCQHSQDGGKMINSKRSALRWFVLFALTFLVAGAPRAQAASSIPPIAPSQDRADLLQFTSAGHILGFAPREMYVASGSHALHVEFVNAGQ